MEVAVTELSRLLDECSANVMAAAHRTAPARVTLMAVKKVEREVTSPEERQQFNKDVTVRHTHTHTRCLASFLIPGG